MTVVNLPSRMWATGAPVLVLLDLQAEYQAEGRAFALEEAGPALANCKRLLDFCRERRLPVAHHRQILSGPFFNEKTEFSRWLTDFLPRPNEMVFERDQPSCYSSRPFADFVDAIDEPLLFLAGLTADRACLATVVETFHRGHRMFYVHDASAAHGVGSRSPGETLEFVTELVSGFCETLSTKDALDQFERMQHHGRRRAMQREFV